MPRSLHHRNGEAGSTTDRKLNPLAGRADSRRYPIDADVPLGWLNREETE
jgi:hypothetical protein